VIEIRAKLRNTVVSMSPGPRFVHARAEVLHFLHQRFFDPVDQAAGLENRLS